MGCQDTRALSILNVLWMCALLLNDFYPLLHRKNIWSKDKFYRKRYFKTSLNTLY